LCGRGDRREDSLLVPALRAAGAERISNFKKELPMLRFALAATLVALPFASAQQSQTSLAAAACPNVWKHEPVATYDIAGSTLIGPIYQHLAIYNDGHMIISRTTFDPDPGAAQTSFLTPAEIQQLRADLIAANVETLCDDPFQASDSPLTTVTYFRGATNASAHSFSYWSGFGGSYAAVDQVFLDLIAAKFPNF
jgi:hypothetical protein